MILDARLQFDDLLSGFCKAKTLSELDMAILDHAIDDWPMGRLVKEYGTTATALHRRERELKLELGEYLKNRGFNSSSDVFDENRYPSTRGNRTSRRHGPYRSSKRILGCC